MSEPNISKRIINIFLVFILINIGFIGLLIYGGLIDYCGVEGATIIVDSNGQGNYTSIQDAINNSNPGDIIYVWKGTYNENLIINKKVTLIGNGSSNTTIDGNLKGEVINITADMVNLTGFTITGSGFFKASVVIYKCKQINFYGNNCSNNNNSGLIIINSSNNNIINNSFINNKMNSIVLKNSDHSIIDNNIIGKFKKAILLENSNYNIIKNNICLTNPIYLYSSSNNKVINNYAYDKTQCFIRLMESSNNNDIINNNFSIYLHKASNNVITENTCSNKGYYDGIFLWESNNNHIYNNNCSNNGASGIYLYSYSHKNNVIDNICLDNNIGIAIGYFTYGNILLNNNCSNNWHGISLSGTGYNSIENNNCSNNEYGITIGRSENLDLSSNILYNNIIGIELYDSISITIDNNTFISCGIVIDGTSLVDSNIINESNTINGKPIYFLKNTNNISVPKDAGEIILVNCHNIIIENQILNNGSIGLIIGYSNNISVKQNICNNNSWRGIYIYKSDFNTISDNKCNFNSVDFDINHYYQGLGLFLEKSNSNLIENNICNYNNNIGLMLSEANKNIIKNNMCKKNSYSGIQIDFSYNNHILFNNGSNNFQTGIELIESEENTIEKNIFNLNGDNGADLRFSSNSNLFFRNICNFNNKSGIFLFENSELNSFFYNNISYNRVSGINLSFSNNNTFYYNNIIENTVEIIDSWINKWNNGKGKGNFWSDYTGVDNGVNNRISGDGIGDTQIPHLGLDNYPFIRESGWYYPKTPILMGPIDVDIDGNYDLSWSKSKNSIGFILEESYIKSFKTFNVLYSGPNTTYKAINKSEGEYFYRIKAYNDYHIGDYSDIINVTVKYPLNLAPFINNSIKTIEILEDKRTLSKINLFDVFTDPENDKLEFKIIGNYNISIKLFENGSIEFLPKKDWNGNETLIFIANDSLNENSVDITIIVNGVNDPPEKPIIFSPNDDQIFNISSQINFKGQCFDADKPYGDKLNYTWQSNISGIFGFNNELINISLPIGTHKIVLTVSDLMNIRNSSNITIIIKDTDSDNDGYNDSIEILLGTNQFDNYSFPDDFDNDLIPDYLDFDDDNDNFSDEEELINKTNPYDSEDYPGKNIPEEDDDKDKKSQDVNYIIYLITGIIVIIFLILLALYIRRKKKKEKKEKSDQINTSLNE